MNFTKTTICKLLLALFLIPNINALAQCNLDAGQIVTDVNLCAWGAPVYLEADYERPADGMDDTEYVFVEVTDDDSFEVISDKGIARRGGNCYYGIHYRNSCDIPNFDAATFSEILNANANYAITDCFQFTINFPPTYTLTTAPYCSGEGLFTIGVTLTGGSGTYSLGIDYTGENYIAKEGENFITYASGGYYSIYPFDIGTQCGSDIIYPVIDPGNCDVLAQFDCAPGRPLDWPWIKDIIATRSGCDVYAIDQFQFEGDTYFRTSPYVSGLPCPADLLSFYYDCDGNEVCRYGFLPSNAPDLCDIEIVNAVENSTNIWRHSFEDCADPLQLEVVQSAIADEYCTQSIYAFDYENQSYVYINNRFFCEAFDNYDLLYDCSVEAYCTVGFCSLTKDEITSFLSEEYSIWESCINDYIGTVAETYESIECYNYTIEVDNVGIIYVDENSTENYELKEGQRVQFSLHPYVNEFSFCPPSQQIICLDVIEESASGCDSAVEPNEYPWIQNLINNWSLCSLFSIDQFDYNGNTYFRASPYNSPNTQTEGLNFNCPTDYLVYYYDCDGNEICVFGNLPLDDPQRCNIEIVDAANNNPTNIWTRSKPCPDPLCDSVGTPVCGVDGNTYSNSCEAECLGIEIAFYEACDKPCPDPLCDSFGTPVCGLDGNTYSNPCEAECLGIEIAYYGECDKPCPDPLCDSVGTPVCGVDGNTYSNPCEAECLGIEIAYYGACNTSNNEVFESFPWLLDLVDPIYCASGLRVDVYMKGVFNYIFVKYPAAPGILYFQNGTYYCEDVRDFSCVAAYSLTDLVASWTCDNELPIDNIEATFNNLICNNNGTFSIDVTATGSLSGSYGIYGIKPNGDFPETFNFEEGETYTFTGEIADNQNNIYTAFIYDRFLADAPATLFEINIEECENDGGDYAAIFIKYPWLYNFTEPCEIGTFIYEFDLGPYTFIQIENDNGRILYYQDGTKYCTDRLNFSCREIYGLTIEPKVYNCSDLPPQNCDLNENPLDLPWLQQAIEDLGADKCGLKEVRQFSYEGENYFHLLSYPIYPNCGADTGGSDIFDCEGNLLCYYNCFCYAPYCSGEIASAGEAGELIWEYKESTILTEYEWLNNLLDPLTCFGTTVREYDNGSFAFIAVEDAEGIQLYFEDGSLFCTDRANLSCVETYGLVDVTDTYTCGFAGRSKTTKEHQRLNRLKEEITIYPNPNNGVFTIDLANLSKQVQKIEIYDVAGKQYFVPVNLAENTTALKLNATNLNSGNYIINVVTENKLYTGTVIIH